MKNILKRFGILVFIVAAAACDLDGDLTNPNEVGVAGSDPNLLMNALQLNFADFFGSASRTVAPLVRHTAMTGGFRYQTAYSPERQDGLWSLAYRQVLVNAQTLIPIAMEKNLTTHVAVAKILMAYTYITLVDIFGEVPQAEALGGPAGNFNPRVTPGADVYAYAINLLEEARIELAKTGTDAGAALTRDIYYAGNRTNWTALANTIELKAWLNISIMPSRAAEANARINTLLASNLVDTEAENFTYKYGTATVPDSRHPLYNQYYGPNAGSAAGYIGTTIMKEMFSGKIDPTDPTRTIQDPRWRYYFYRQVGSIAEISRVDPKALGCAPGAPPDHYIAGNYPFCVVEGGFYGRDHGDASGTPPDSPTITCVAVYPAGGRVDNTAITNTTYRGPTIRGDGANGAGIEPIFMAFYTDFYRAEILARTGNITAARTQLATAIGNSITQIRNFATSKNQVVSAANIPSTTTYLTAVDNLYGAAANKLRIVGREAWIAYWGNGIEAYNSYRRTSGPDILQPTVQINEGPFLRSMIYSANYVNLNSNASQKDTNVTVKVFWDANPDDLK
jgi:hypothetical protein